MDRLSGSPYDIINPNGLAFVIIMTLPLLYLVLKPRSLLPWIDISRAGQRDAVTRWC